jgi:hypothetical protein
MEYPPNFLGFLKALFDTLRGKKLRPRIPKDEPARDIDDFEIYEPDKDPGIEWWREKLNEKVQQDELENAEAEQQMIKDYESRHAENSESDEKAGEMESDNANDFGSDFGNDGFGCDSGNHDG